MAVYEDTFSGSGALGTIEKGGVAWEAITGTWSRSNGYASTSTAASSNPIAVIDTGVGQIDTSINCSSGGGDALYFRVVDASNWLRARVYSVTTSSTYYQTEYRIADVTVEYEYRFYQVHDPSMGTHTGIYSGTASPSNDYDYRWLTSDSQAAAYVAGGGTYVSHDHSGGGNHYHEYTYKSYTATGNSRNQINGYYWSTSSNPDGSGPDYWTGETQSVPYSSSSTTRTVYLEKCVAGTVTSLGSYNTSASTLRVRADGPVIQVYINGTLRITGNDSTHSTATKHGVGRGATSNNGSAIDNFSLEPLIPPTPTIKSPTAGSVVNTATPVLVGTATAWGSTPTKMEWQIAYDSAFTTGLYSIIEPDTAYRVSGDYSLSIPVEDKLTQRAYYARARQVSSGGLNGPWTTAVAFTVSHPPSATNLAPTSNQGVIMGASNRFSWVFADTSVTDSQSAYQLVIERNDTAQTVLDTLKTASSALFRDITISSSYENVQLRWRLKVWDSEDVASTFTNYQLFIPTTPPSIAITSPVDGSDISTSRPTITWTFSASGSRTQANYRVTIQKVGESVLLFDSGIIAGTETSYTVNTPVIENANQYKITIYVTDSIGIGVLAITTVNAVYEEPALVQFVADDKYYESEGFVHVYWGGTELDAMFVAWRVYRKNVNDASYTRIAEIPQAEITEIRDWLIPSLSTFRYYVVQVVERFEEQVESVVAAPVEVTLGTGGYWMIDPVDPANSIRLHNVTQESYTEISEQAEYLIVGRGRHIDEGETIGIEGTLVAQLRSSIDGTAREKKLKIETLKRQKKPVYLRNPFGDIWYISIGTMSVERVAGVGVSEFVDVTVPYKQIF